RLTFAFLRQVIHGTGTVDAGQGTDSEMLDRFGLKLPKRPEVHHGCITTPESARQLKVPLIVRTAFDGFENEMAEEESQIHRRIAKVGRFVVYQGEAPRVREDVFRAVITVAKGNFAR